MTLDIVLQELSILVFETWILTSLELVKQMSLAGSVSPISVLG